MTQLALARKYRPKRFADLVGQEHVAAGLAGAVAKERVAHAYLLTGPRGVGKTSAARILAMALNCERRDAGGGEPCGTCESCTRTWAGAASLDVVEIDAASNRGVDDARDLRERAMYAASGAGRHKVYIVDEAHMLTREAWNALLKILEEPPPQVVFVFATTEPQKIANTAAPVLSRLQRFDFRRLGPAAVADRLAHVAQQEGIATDADALPLIARVAAGGMRDALSLLDQARVFGDGPVTASGVRTALGLIDDEVYGELLDVVAGRRSPEVFAFVARLVEAGADLAEFVNGAGDVLRALLLRLVAGGADAAPPGPGADPASQPVRRAVDAHAGAFRPGDVLRMLKLLAEAETVIRRSPNARLHVETLLLQWTLLDRTVELEDVLDAVRGTGRVDGWTGGRVGRDKPPEMLRDSAPVGSVPSAPPPVDPSTRLPVGSATGALTLEAVTARWEAVLDAVGRKKRMLREALGHAVPVAVEGGVLRLAVTDAVHLDGLERGRGAISQAVAEVAGHAVQVVLEAGGAERRAPAPAPPRLDQQTDRDERLRVYRGKDPALDRAADLLDLELTE